jgi:radical SAM protein with 4Fe4S-binding SPASM domain
MENEIKVDRKDQTEDIGFLSQIDPWKALSEFYGDSFKEYRKKWEQASNFELELEYPLQIDFELNNNCNFRCPMCILSIENKPKAEYFPEELYKKIISEGVKKGLRAIDFSYVNEPLIRKDLPDLIAYARDEGILDMAFNTNVQLLTESYAERLLESGLTRIQFSIDAHSSEIFDKVRVGGNFDKVVQNTLKFLELKEKHNKKGIMTAVSFVKMSVNEHEWNDFVAFWKDKVDYIILREYLIPVGRNSNHYDDKKKLFSDHKHHIKEFRCNKPWQRLIIRTDGTVLPCCTSFGALIPVGNIFKESVEDIWNCDSMKKLRELHKNGEYFKNKVCLECALGSTMDNVI